MTKSAQNSAKTRASLHHLRLARTYIEHLPWEECIQRYDRPHTLFYCDPPYWGTEGYGVDFGLEQYDRMAELARSIKGVSGAVNTHYFGGEA